jgi:hypothetical protein
MLYTILAFIIGIIIGAEAGVVLGFRHAQRQAIYRVVVVRQRRRGPVVWAWSFRREAAGEFYASLLDAVMRRRVSKATAVEIENEVERL